MTINNLKDLEKLIKLCRKTGIDSITVDGVSLSLGSSPVTKKPYKDSQNQLDPAFDPGPITPPDTLENIGLTQEQLLMWSVDETNQ